MAEVSRGTDAPTADIVKDIFRQRAEATYRYVDTLATGGVERGLIGPREVARLWSRHVLNCAVVAPALPEAASVCDIGSGAGLPGVVFALARPDVSVVLAEPLLRRSTFLTEVVADLELENVEVVRARAEEIHDRMFDVVTARAVAPLDRLARWALPLCRPGGTLLALKGATAQEELTAAETTLRRLGATSTAIEQFGVGVVSPSTTVVRIQSSDQRHGSRKGSS